MGTKRKAASEARGQTKRLQKSAPFDGLDGNEEDLSDLESLSSYCVSNQSEDDLEHITPTTPFSPASSRYPSDRKTHLCPFEGCGKAFNRPARLTEHLRSHNNERIFNCTYDNCDKTFLRASHLNHHVKSAHTSIRDYVCDREGCGKTFVTGSRLRRHLLAHEGRDKYRCTEYPPCNETFRKHSTLQKHIMMSHLNQKPFPCPHADPVTGNQCPQAFDTAGHLRAHEARIHGGTRFTCTECSSTISGNDTAILPEGTSSCEEVTFPTYALLQAHMRSAHPPSCPQCNVVCTSSKELKRHLEITHGSTSVEERKLHPCHYPDCGRSFTKKGNLNVHIRTVHEGEKRFICGETDLSASKKVENWTGEDSCGKRYGSKLALEEHVRTAHLGLKNAKAERRDQLGLGTRVKKEPSALSNLAMLTGEGYVEESGRHIPCLIEQCEHRFHRDYDLWGHMTGKHGLQENDVQILFMQRTMHGGFESFNYNFDSGHDYTNDNGGVEMSYDQPSFEVDASMYSDVQNAFGDAFTCTGTTHDDTDMGLIDPVLTYTMEQ